MIEQEADTEGYDSRDRPFIQSLTGDKQRAITGLVGVYIEDDSITIRTWMIEQLRVGAPARQRSEQIDHYLTQLAVADTSRQATTEDVRAHYAKDVA